VCPIKFFNIQLNTEEIVGLDGEVLKGLYQIESCYLVLNSKDDTMLTQRLAVASVGARYVAKTRYVVCSGVAKFCPIFGSVPASSRSILGRWRKITYNPPAIPNRIYGNG
jgi:hypothetical protein